MSDSLVCVKDFEKYAYLVLSRNTLDYYRCGAGDEQTLAENRKAFSKYKIRPRCLRNVANRDLSTTILGRKVEIPVGISPTAFQKIIHPDGEFGSAKAAKAMGTVFILSIVASCTIEELGVTVPDGNNWLQMYVYSDKQITQKLVQKAEQSNFKALVITVDTPTLGRRLVNYRNQFVVPPNAILPSHMRGRELFNPSLDWNDIKWLKSITKLPIVLKGILTVEDAIIAADIGIDGILVSNHGGRQLDGSPATIEVLPEIVKAVGNRTEIYMDGGVTDGSDVFKALALGAKMVFMGRGPIWGLAHSGEEGVKKVLNLVKSELDCVLAIAGCATLKDIEPGMVVPNWYYNKL